MKSYFRRTIALPSDHGSWVFILSPLIIGLFAGGQWQRASFSLIAAVMVAFLFRQPVTMAVKSYSGRRSRRDFPVAFFWIIVYGLIGLAAIISLVRQNYTYILLLALPGVLVFAWHLHLVSRRSERRQLGVELAGVGVLALAAPAAMWVGKGEADPEGWLLFLLVWLQSAASIVYAYLRLEQRTLPNVPDVPTRLQMAKRALFYTSFNLLATCILAVLGSVPVLLPLPYAVQWVETLWGTFHPAVGLKPAIIGVRQLMVSILFTILFIFTWNLK